MTQGSWDMSINDPVQGFGKEVENVWCGFKAKDKDNIVVEIAVPETAEKVPVARGDGDVAKGLLQIKLSKK